MEQLEPLLPKTQLWPNQKEEDEEEEEEEEAGVGLVARHSRHPDNGVGTIPTTTTSGEPDQPAPASAPTNGTASELSEREDEAAADNSQRDEELGDENGEDKAVKGEEDGVINSVYFDKLQGIWKCRHCNWTHQIGSPCILDVQNPKGYLHMAMNSQTLNQLGPSFTLETKGTESINGVSEMQSEISKSLSTEINHQLLRSVEDQNLFGLTPAPVEQSHEETNTSFKHVDDATKVDANFDLIEEVEEDLMELDVERVLEKQNTHDLYCPNCNSCITRRVILRRRKPKVSNIRHKPKHVKKLAPIPTSVDNGLGGDTSEIYSDVPPKPKHVKKLAPIPTSVADDHSGDTSEIYSNVNPTPAPGLHNDRREHEREAFSCLSCFSLFIPIGNGCFKMLQFFRRGNEDTQSPEMISQSGNTQSSQETSQRKNTQSSQETNLSKDTQSPQKINQTKNTQISSETDLSQETQSPRETSQMGLTQSLKGISQNGMTRSPPKVSHYEDTQSPSRTSGNEDTQSPQKRGGDENTHSPEHISGNEDAQNPQKRGDDENKHSPQHISHNEDAQSPQRISLNEDTQGTQKIYSNENTQSPQNINQNVSKQSSQKIPKAGTNWIFSVLPFFKGKATVDTADHASSVQSDAVPTLSVISGEPADDAEDNEIEDIETGLLKPTEVGNSSQTGNQNECRDANAGEVHEWEILKCIVYGGLIECITSLGVVSSAAGAGADTLNILALGLANLIGGLIVIIHNLKELRNDQPRGTSSAINIEEDRYQVTLGQRQNFVLHITVAILSFIIFGLVPPVVYGFSFRKSDDRDLKLAAVAGASLICIMLLALGKGHVRKPHRAYFRTVSYYVILGFTASGISYVAGELIKKLVEKLGLFESSSAVGLPFLETIQSEVGRASY